MSLKGHLSNLLAKWSTNSQYMSLPGSSTDGQRVSFRSRRVAVALVLVATGLLSLAWLSSGGSGAEVESTAPKVNQTLSSDSGEQWDPLSVLEGPPPFPDNLRSDKKYITAWIGSGWTNDVMSYINLIYLGLITERIPVIPTFATTHGISVDEEKIRFSEVFDLQRLQKELRMPVIEWGDVKQNTSVEVDEIGCWSSWLGLKPESSNSPPIWTAIPHWLKLDISYTPAPRWINLSPTGNDIWGSFSAYAALTFPEQITEYATDPIPSPEQGLKLPPDQHMVCFDQTYYVGGLADWEYRHDYGFAWRFVGKYLHWNHRLEGIANQYVRKTLGVADGENTPTWITVHARRGDFTSVCREYNVPLDSCYPPISAFVKQVEAVKQELLDKTGMVVDNVIMTSDEKDPKWWEEVAALGWRHVDHSETGEQYGVWYPIFIDAVIQSGGMGLVGTEKSTMSVIAQRRVEAWRDGSSRMVKFPYID